MVLFDYFSFTVLDDSFNYHSLLKFLEIDSTKLVELNGINGYTRRYMYNGINICTEGLEGMGVYVFATGEGCRTLESNVNFNWKNFFTYVNSMKCNIKRLDIARDCFNYEINLEEIEEFLLNGECISVFSRATIITAIESIKTGKTGGKTINIGSRSSNVFVRMYDKKEEQKSDKEYWVRIELELKCQIADGFINCYLNSTELEPIGELYSRLLNRYIRFADKSNDTNRSRWQTKLFWVEFINQTKKLYLSIKKGIKSFNHLRKHFIKQYSRFLAMMCIADDDESVLLEIAQNSLKNIKKYQLNIVNSYRESMGNAPIVCPESINIIGSYMPIVNKENQNVKEYDFFEGL